MDFDGDGRTDNLSGSGPGQLYLFRRLEDGTFAEPEVLKNKDDKPIKAGAASVAFAHDWDCDGDLDLLVGTIGGQVWFVCNEGSREEPGYGEAKSIVADGDPICVPGGDAGPCVADWDADGKADLLVGCATGGVFWYRNTGAKGKPKLTAAAMLVPTTDRRGKSESLSKATGDLPTLPGSRTKICVADFNGDGRLDLLVGDMQRQMVETRELTDEEKAADKALKEKQMPLLGQYNELRKGPKDESEEAKTERRRKFTDVYGQLRKI